MRTGRRRKQIGDCWDDYSWLMETMDQHKHRESKWWIVQIVASLCLVVGNKLATATFLSIFSCSSVWGDTIVIVAWAKTTSRESLCTVNVAPKSQGATTLFFFSMFWSLVTLRMCRKGLNNKKDDDFWRALSKSSFSERANMFHFLFLFLFLLFQAERECEGQGQSIYASELCERLRRKLSRRTLKHWWMLNSYLKMISRAKINNEINKDECGTLIGWKITWLCFG